MPYRTVIRSVSFRRELLEYARAVADKERAAKGRRVSVSEVVSWGLRALKVLRHDVPGKANALELTVEARERGALSGREAAENVRTVAGELAGMKAAVQATTHEGDMSEGRTSANASRAPRRAAGRTVG